MRNTLIAALAALALLAVCSCAEPDAPEAKPGSQSAISESEDTALSEVGSDASSDSSVSKKDKTSAKDSKKSTDTATDTEAASKDELSVDGDEMISEDNADHAGDDDRSDVRADTTSSRSGSNTTRAGSTTTRADQSTTRSGSTTTRSGSTTTRSDATTTRSGSSTSKSDTSAHQDPVTAAAPDESKAPPETTAQPEPEPAAPAPSYPLKSGQSAPAEANDHNVPKADIVEGAGPLGFANIYIGSNDFMFYGDCIDDLVGEKLFSDKKLSRFADVMNERDAWAKENGINLIFVIAPNKATVYNDYVPSSVVQSSTTKCDQVVDYLAANSSVKVLDLRRTLRNARASYGDELYYRYDTHWNQNGGFAAYGAIMDEVRKARPNAVKYAWEDFNVEWYETYMKDNAWYLGWYDAYTDYGPVYSLKVGPAATLVSKFRNGTVGGQYALAYHWPDGYSDDLTYLYYKSKNTAAPTLYMYQDSFGISLMPFLKESFAEANFEWSHSLSKNDILEMGADTLIIEVAEKGLGEFIKLHAFY